MAERYQQALGYLLAATDSETSPLARSAAGFDLRRVVDLMSRLGNPQDASPSAHIAGTKGKGSVAAMMASVLTASGYRTGLYTSPHLCDIRERLRVDGRLISQDELVRLVDIIKPQAELVDAVATYGKLTTFELLTALGFCLFRERAATFQVVETGLGGRLDATNVLRPEVAVITAISLDHTEVLGETLAQIAAEKAGIIKQGVPVVSAPQSAEVLAVIEQACAAKNALLTQVGRDVGFSGKGFAGGRQLIVVEGRLGEYHLSLPLLGHYQLENAASAVAALEVLSGCGFHIPASAIEKGMAQVRWPGRFQVIGRRPLVIADGAHNAASAAELVQSLLDYPPSQGTKERLLVFGTSLDKDVPGMVAELKKYFRRVIVTHSSHPRALDVAPVLAEFRGQGFEVESSPSVAAALAIARQSAGSDGLVCVTGSLFIVGEALAAESACPD